ATSLEGVYILWSFDESKIQCCQSQDIRNKLKHLQSLALRTIAQYRDNAEREDALRALYDLGVHYDFDTKGNLPCRQVNIPRDSSSRAYILGSVQDSIGHELMHSIIVAELVTWMSLIACTANACALALDS
ncbi:hypothetical protein GY45DRAFT_1258802, partial [Cubamyces sp. BRFM 1775]